jgi:hypothetical protein
MRAYISKNLVLGKKVFFYHLFCNDWVDIAYRLFVFQKTSNAQFMALVHAMGSFGMGVASKKNIPVSITSLHKLLVFGVVLRLGSAMAILTRAVLTSSIFFFSALVRTTFWLVLSGAT